MTDLEKEINEHLMSAWRIYQQLENEEGRQCVSDISDFCKGIQDCQKILALRVARDHEPRNFLPKYIKLD